MPCLCTDTSGGIYACNGHLPGSMGHWEQDAAVFAEWRLDMVKMDFVRIPWPRGSVAFAREAPSF